MWVHWLVFFFFRFLRKSYLYEHAFAIKRYFLGRMLHFFFSFTFNRHLNYFKFSASKYLDDKNNVELHQIYSQRQMIFFFSSSRKKFNNKYVTGQTAVYYKFRANYR